MLRFLICLIAIGASLAAQVLPQQFGEYTRAQVSRVSPDDAAIWAEYGLEATEKAAYSGGGVSFTATAYRMKDPTGAYAAFQWQRPADAQSAATSASTPTGALVLHQNYLLLFEGGKPHPANLGSLYGQLPKLVNSSLPLLAAYLPKKNRVPNSERYILGPVSLAKFEPRISAELAAFDRGAEAQLARYRLNGVDSQLTILSYPTPQMAIERTREFQKLAGAAVRRTGPMVLVIPEAQKIPAAAKLLDGINYSASLTWNEEAPKDTVQDAAKMILAISLLAVGLILSSVLLGMFFGGGKQLLRRLGMKDAAEDFTTLNIGG